MTHFFVWYRTLAEMTLSWRCYASMVEMTPFVEVMQVGQKRLPLGGVMQIRQKYPLMAVLFKSSRNALFLNLVWNSGRNSPPLAVYARLAEVAPLGGLIQIWQKWPLMSVSFKSSRYAPCLYWYGILAEITTVDDVIKTWQKWPPFAVLCKSARYEPPCRCYLNLRKKKVYVIIWYRTLAVMDSLNGDLQNLAEMAPLGGVIQIWQKWPFMSVLF